MHANEVLFSALLPALIKEREEREPHDEILPLQKFSWTPFNEEGVAIPEVSYLLPGESDPWSEPITLSVLALKQLCSLAKIPYTWFEQIESSNLRYLNINYGIQNHMSDRPHMVRMEHGSQARAILSANYKPLDNIPVLELLTDIVDPDSNVEEITTGEISYMRVTWKNSQVEPIVGDPVKVGVLIRNSEVGLSNLVVDGLIYRLVCSNGMITASRDSRNSFRHMGIGSTLSTSVKAAIDVAAVETTKLLENFSVAKKVKIAETSTFFDVLQTNQINLLKAEAEKVAVKFAAGGDNTLYGMAQAITATAKELGHTRRQMFETLGGRLIAEPKRFSIPKSKAA